MTKINLTLKTWNKLCRKIQWIFGGWQTQWCWIVILSLQILGKQKKLYSMLLKFFVTTTRNVGISYIEFWRRTYNSNKTMHKQHLLCSYQSQH